MWDQGSQRNGRDYTLGQGFGSNTVFVVEVDRIERVGYGIFEDPTRCVIVVGDLDVADDTVGFTYGGLWLSPQDTSVFAARKRAYETKNPEQ